MEVEFTKFDEDRRNLFYNNVPSQTSADMARIYNQIYG